MLERFASKTHAVGVRFNRQAELEIVAPFGLNDLFSFRIVPNYFLENRHAHEAKANRALRYWPELTLKNW